MHRTVIIVALLFCLARRGGGLALSAAKPVEHVAAPDLKPSFKPSTNWIKKAQQLQETGKCKFAGKQPGLTQIEIPFVLLVSAKGGVQSVKVGDTGCPELETYVGQIVRRFGPAQIVRPKGMPPFWRQSRFVAGLARLTLRDDQLERYARHIVLKEIGGEGQRRLLDAHVAVIGAGGIGSPVIQYLAAAGVGRLTVIDDDIIALSNLQRQTLFGTSDVGLAKTAVASEVVARL
jgi:hypothetical protein